MQGGGNASDDQFALLVPLAADEQVRRPRFGAFAEHHDIDLLGFLGIGELRGGALGSAVGALVSWFVREELIEQARTQLGVDVGHTAGRGGRQLFQRRGIERPDGGTRLVGERPAEAADVGVSASGSVLQFEHQFLVVGQDDRFSEREDRELGFVRFGSEGRPAVARVVVERVADVAVAAVLAGLGRVRRDRADGHRFARLGTARSSDLHLDIGQDEMSRFGAGQAGFRTSGVGEDFQLEAGDPLESRGGRCRLRRVSS